MIKNLFYTPPDWFLCLIYTLLSTVGTILISGAIVVGQGDFELYKKEIKNIEANYQLNLK